VQCRFDVDHFVAGQHAALHRFPDAGFDRLDVLARNYPPDNRVDELEACSRFRRFNPDLRVPVLAAASSLAHELAHPLRCFSNRLSISDLRTANVRVDAELSLQAIDDNLEMKLAHPADDCLACLLIGRNLETWIFSRQPLKPEAEFFLIRSCFW